MSWKRGSSNKKKENRKKRGVDKTMRRGKQ
jgi:hypothetical protein